MEQTLNLLDSTQLVIKMFPRGTAEAAEQAVKEGTKKEFLAELKATYKTLDLETKASIKEKLVTIKSEHEENLAKIETELAEALKRIEAEHASDDPEDKQLAKNREEATKGATIMAKRARIKETNRYYEAIKEEKLRRFDLHTEYHAIIKSVTGKSSFIENLRSSALENSANFNFKKAITNKKMWFNLIPLFMLILMIAMYAIASVATGYKGDLTDVINQGIFVAVVAVGAVYIYSSGGFDMSLGSAALMCAIVAAFVWNATHNAFLSFVLSVVLGAGLGIINAVLATLLGLPVMVMTLTMMNILNAISSAIIMKAGLIEPDAGLTDNAWIYAIYLAVFFLLLWAIFNYSKLGRRNKFIGSNKTAAKFNGIPLLASGIISFAISGIGLGICGYIFVSTRAGQSFDSNTVLGSVGLNVIIAIVFGGMTTSGGPKSKVSCAIIGAFFCVFLEQFFWAISAADFRFIAKGVVFLIVSLANMWDTRTKRLAAGGSIQ